MLLEDSAFLLTAGEGGAPTSSPRDERCVGDLRIHGALPNRGYCSLEGRHHQQVETELVTSWAF